MRCTDLLVIAVERRRIAIAAFSGVRMDYVQVRELSSREEQAGRTVQRFLNWAIATFEPAQVAIQAPPPTSYHRRLYLHAVARGALVEVKVPVIEVEQKKLRYLLTVPHVRSRVQARAIADHLWPELIRHPQQPAPREAALIGIHVQMTDLFADK